MFGVLSRCSRKLKMLLLKDHTPLLTASRTRYKSLQRRDTGGLPCSSCQQCTHGQQSTAVSQSVPQSRSQIRKPKRKALLTKNRHIKTRTCYGLACLVGYMKHHPELVHTSPGVAILPAILMQACPQREGQVYPWRAPFCPELPVRFNRSSASVFLSI